MEPIVTKWMHYEQDSKKKNQQLMHTFSRQREGSSVPPLSYSDKALLCMHRNSQVHLTDH